MDIGANIKRIRKEKKMTQKELGKELNGISQQQIARWENGDKNITLENLRKISAALGVYISDLVDDWSEAGNKYADNIHLEVAKKMPPLYHKKPGDKIEFFMPITPPTSTHQEKQVKVVNGKPVFYEPQEVKAARQKLQAHLGRHVPNQEFKGPVRLTTWWCFPVKGKHHDGEYRTSRPDTDNLVKMLKDVMTDLHFWKDDAQVASEVTEKYWADMPGIYVKVESLNDE